MKFILKMFVILLTLKSIWVNVGQVIRTNLPLNEILLGEDVPQKWDIMRHSSYNVGI